MMLHVFPGNLGDHLVAELNILVQPVWFWAKQLGVLPDFALNTVKHNRNRFLEIEPAGIGRVVTFEAHHKQTCILESFHNIKLFALDAANSLTFWCCFLWPFPPITLPHFHGPVSVHFTSPLDSVHRDSHTSGGLPCPCFRAPGVIETSAGRTGYLTRSKIWPPLLAI